MSMVEEPWQVLSYSFTISPGKPYGVDRVMAIFHLEPKDVTLASHATVDGNIMYSDHNCSAASQVSSRMGISDCDGAFSGSFSMSMENEQSSKTATVRVDAHIHASKFDVRAGGGFRLNPAKKLDPDVAEFIRDCDVEEIEGNLGSFYCSGCSLGGVFHKSYVMESYSTDTRASVTAELEASYGIGLVSGNAAGGASASSRRDGASMQMTWHCEGGDPTLWLGATKDNIDEIQNKWAASVSDANLFPSHMALVPMWELVKKVDAGKGEALEKHLKAKWSGSGGKPQRMEFLTPPFVHGIGRLSHNDRAYANNVPVELKVEEGKATIAFRWDSKADGRKNVHETMHFENWHDDGSKVQAWGGQYYCFKGLRWGDDGENIRGFFFNPGDWDAYVGKWSVGPV